MIMMIIIICSTTLFVCVCIVLSYIYIYIYTYMYTYTHTYECSHYTRERTVHHNTVLTFPNVSGCSPIVYRHMVKVIALPTFSYLILEGRKREGERERFAEGLE